MDQFWARHLRPLLRCTADDLCAIVPWRVPEMPPLAVSIDSVKTLLCKARRFTPYRDLLEYCMLEWLQDPELQWVADFIQNVSVGTPLRSVVNGDFYAHPA